MRSLVLVALLTVGLLGLASASLSGCGVSLPETDSALASQVNSIGATINSNLQGGVATPSSQQGAYLVAAVGSTDVSAPVGAYSVLEVLVTQTDGATPAPGVIVWFQSPDPLTAPWGLGTSTSAARGIAQVQAAPRVTGPATVIASVLAPAASDEVDFLIEGR